mgnify:CR=1 FL=1
MEVWLPGSIMSVVVQQMGKEQGAETQRKYNQVQEELLKNHKTDFMKYTILLDSAAE